MSDFIDLGEAPDGQIFSPKVGFWNYDPDNDKIIISEKSAEVLGVESKAKTLRQIAGLVIKKDQGIFKNFVNKLRSEKSFLGVEFRVNTANDPKIKWISCYGEYQKGQGGTPGYFTGYYINITAKKKKELKLTISNSNFEKIEDISHMGSFNWVFSDNYLLCSDNFFNLTKLKKTQPDNKLEKDDFFNLINSNSKNFVLDVMHEGINMNKSFEVSFALAKHPDIKLKLFGYPFNHGHETEFFGLVQDISYSGESRNSLIEGQDSERKRLSLELHDSVGQKLIAVKYKLALIKMTRDLNELEYVNKSIDQVIDEIRTITHNLSSQIVNEVGLKEAINQILTETAAALNANKQFEYQVERDVLSVDKEKMIYRIVQESLSNALKHSNADNLSVKFNIINNQVSITIADDGVGFDSESNINRGIGLQNIKERVTYLNGFFKLTSEKGKGTSIRVKIPLNR